MYCPKCGGESLETQRFCKACGTNLQLINDALRTGDTPQGPFGLDVDALARNAREFAQSWKTSWSGGADEKGRLNQQRVVGLRINREIRRQEREEARRRNLPNGHVQGLEPLVRILWLIALLPVLKGLAQIIYAAFFGESIATLAARFTPQPLLEQPQAVLRQDTAPVAEQEPARSYDPSIDPPPSVTERTTHIFEENQRTAKGESQ
jgi:hypothetical protein